MNYLDNINSHYHLNSAEKFFSLYFEVYILKIRGIQTIVKFRVIGCVVNLFGKTKMALMCTHTYIFSLSRRFCSNTGKGKPGPGPVPLARDTCSGRTGTSGGCCRLTVCGGVCWCPCAWYVCSCYQSRKSPPGSAHPPLS